MRKNSSQIASGSFSDAICNSTTHQCEDYYFKKSGNIIVNKLNPSTIVSDSYELRIYILETGNNQLNLLDGEFSARIKYVALTDESAIQ